MKSRSSRSGYVVAAASLVLAVWSAELVLARVTSEPQSLVDVLESLLGLGVLGVVPVALFARMRPGRPRDLLVAAASLPALALVSLGVLVPLLADLPVVAALAVVAALGAALVAWRAALAWSGRPPVPSPAAGVAVVAVSAVASWLYLNGRLPDLPRLGALLALFAVIAWTAGRPRLRAVPLVLGFAVALTPRLPDSPEWTASQPPPPGPDIVLLVVDTLRSDHGARMASYQRIAADGVAFPNAQAASPWTTPSMGTIFTGLRPPEHGAVRLNRKGQARGVLRDDVRTLAERLHEVGYDTAGIVTSDAAGSRSGFARGHAYWFEETQEWSLPRARSARQARPTFARLLTQLGLQGRPPSADSHVQTQRALEVIEARRPDRPLFLWVHYLDPHLPYRRADELDLPWRLKVALDIGLARTFLEDSFWRGDAGSEAMLAAYQHEVDVIDQALGQLLDALGPPPERGRVVVFTSDHGEEFFEHDGLLHGHAMYQEVVGVPLVISGLEGRAPGSVDASVVGHQDLMPTLLAAAGLPADGFIGQDLARPVEERIYVSENLSSYPSDASIAARQGRWKLIVKDGEAPQLYDLAADPLERENVAHRNPEVVQRLRAALAVEATEATEMDLSAEDRRMLEALGYLE